MNEANIRKVLDRFMELFEMKLEKNIGLWESERRRGKPLITENRVMTVFVESYKSVMRELCVTGCPYGEIWGCKK